MKQTMQTIGTIMEMISVETVENIEELMRRGLNEMEMESIEWKKIHVYAKSVNKMKIILENDISFLFAIVASMREMMDNNEEQTVNVIVVKSKEESSVCSHKVGNAEILSIVSIKESYFRKISSKKN